MALVEEMPVLPLILIFEPKAFPMLLGRPFAPASHCFRIIERLSDQVVAQTMMKRKVAALDGFAQSAVCRRCGYVSPRVMARLSWQALHALCHEHSSIDSRKSRL